MKNILIITDSYPPEIRSASHLMKDLADGLKENGHRVFVATSEPRYNLESARKIFPKIAAEDGIKILRIKTLPHHKVNFVVRGISQLLLPYLFFWEIKKNIKERIDAVIVHSPPLPLAIAAGKAKKLFGAKYILNLHDIFPQNAVDLGILTFRPLVKFFERMERRVYREADFIVVPSEGHKIFLRKKRQISENKIRVIFHWIDLRPFRNLKRTGRFRRLYGLEDKFFFLFGGVLGPSQGLDLIIRAARKVADIKDILFLFVGDGAEKNNLMKLAENYGLRNVVFKPFVPPEQYWELAKDADVGLVCLSVKNTTPAVPAKILNYMAASVPVAAFVHQESEIHKIIKDAVCGYSAISDNDEKAAEIIKKIYRERNKLNRLGGNGFNYVLKNMEKKIAVGKFEEILMK